MNINISGDRITINDHTLTKEECKGKNTRNNLLTFIEKAEIPQDEIADVMDQLYGQVDAWSVENDRRGD